MHRLRWLRRQPKSSPGVPAEAGSVSLWAVGRRSRGGRGHLPRPLGVVATPSAGGTSAAVVACCEDDPV